MRGSTPFIIVIPCYKFIYINQSRQHHRLPNLGPLCQHSIHSTVLSSIPVLLFRVAASSNRTSVMGMWGGGWMVPPAWGRPVFSWSSDASACLPAPSPLNPGQELGWARVVEDEDEWTGIMRCITTTVLRCSPREISALITVLIYSY